MLGSQTANVLNAIPTSARSSARKALQDIYNAEDRDHAVTAVAVFEKTYGAKWPKAVKKITDDVDELLAPRRHARGPAGAGRTRRWCGPADGPA